MIPSMLLCTVGTSLFYPNLEGLKTALSTGKIRLEHRALAEAYTQQDWTGVAQQLTGIDPEERLCGAEINSIAKSGHERFVHSRGDLGLFLGGYALDRRCDLRCIIELGAFVLPWSICLHVPLDVLHQIA